MFKKIVVATDGSEPSDHAVGMARTVASSLGSEVIVLHVRERMVSRVGVYTMETHEDAVALVDEALATLKDAGVNARAEIVEAVEGHIANAVSDAAQTLGADLIVVGTRGLTDFGAMVVGSVTHRLLHVTTTPVLVVR